MTFDYFRFKLSLFFFITMKRGYMYTLLSKEFFQNCSCFAKDEIKDECYIHKRSEQTKIIPKPLTLNKYKCCITEKLFPK